MLALLRPFLDICLLRRGPQDLPASTLLLGITLGAHVLSGSFLAAVYYAPGTALLVGMTDTVLVALLIGTTLVVQRLQARVLQTLSALAGTDVLLQAVALPLSVWIVANRMSGQSMVGPELLSYALLFWSWAISAHIIRHALGVRFGSAFAIALLFFLVSFNVMHNLFPDPSAKPEPRGELVAPGTTLR